MNNGTTLLTQVNKEDVLYGGPYLQINPDIAGKLGLNEAIVLPQLHILTQENPIRIEGYNWVHKTYDEWQQHFPFWSKKTIARIFHRLEKKGFIIVKRQFHPPFDINNYYRIDYDNLERFLEDNE